jgi:predicted lipoprotein with Yx(FWY)xxD motif
MKKIIIAMAVLIVIAGGAYAIFHKSSKPASSSDSGSASQSNAPAVDNAVIVTKNDPKLGQYLADPSGKALYTYNADTKGVSNCTGSCLAAWPAYVDKGSTANLPAGVGTITRKDTGQIQYTYNDLPLYFFVSDSPGKVTGNGVQNFSVAKPATGNSSSSSSSSSPSTSTQPSNTSSTSPGYNY